MQLELAELDQVFTAESIDRGVQDTCSTGNTGRISGIGITGTSTGNTNSTNPTSITGTTSVLYTAINRFCSKYLI